MPLYRCSIHGKKFPGVLIGSKKPCGFYATRFIEADSPEHAELLVVELLKSDESLQVAEKYRTDSAKIFIKKIEAVEKITGPNKGFTFYGA